MTVVNLKPANPSREDSRDSTQVKTVAGWWVARREAQLHWAKGDASSQFGSIGDGEAAPHEALERMRACEDVLSRWEPKTVRAADLMLQIAVEILNHGVAYPDASLSAGPVMEIVGNVQKALGRLSGETAIPTDDDAPVHRPPGESLN
jgi:hypothetical protein